MNSTELELVDLNMDYDEIKDVFVDSDGDELYDIDSPNIYINTASDTRREDHFSIINDLKSNYSQISSVNQMSAIINSNPAPTNIVEDGILESPSLAGAVGANAFLITENWGHEYLTAQDSGGYYFADAEKHPTGSGAGDYLLCWAAAASNLLQWGGWANDVDVSISTEQDVLDYYAAHWTDEGGFTTVGWEWWLTGDESSWYTDNYPSASHVDVGGGGFFSTTFSDSASTISVIDTAQRDNGAFYTFDTYWDFMVEHMDAGYGVYLGLSFGSNMGHAITAWGYEETDGIKYLYYSDSDDDMNPTGAAAAPDFLKKTRLTLEATQIFNPSLTPNDIYVLNDYGSRTELDQVGAIRQYDSDMIGVAEDFTDARQISVSSNTGTRRGNVDITGDNDYYFVDLTAGYVNISVSALTYANTDFSIYNEAKTLIQTVTGSDTYGFSASAGKYYIVVEGGTFLSLSTVTNNTYVINLTEDVTAPTTPVNLTSDLANIGNDLVIDWDAASDSGSGLKEYNVEVASDSSFTSITNAATVTSSNGSFDNLADGTYYWRVQAEDIAGNTSAWSETKLFIVDTENPTAPSGLVAEDKLDNVLGVDYFTWTVSSDAGSGVKEYVVEYSENAGESAHPDSGTITVTNPEILISSLPGMLTYHWRVKAVDNVGRTSAWSAWTDTFVADATAPLTPGGLGRSGDNFVWNAAYDFGSGVEKYIIEYSENADLSSSTTKESSTNSIALAGLNLTAHNYYWRVKSVDKVDNESGFSTIQTFTLAESDNQTKPVAPTGYTHFGSAIAISGDNIAVGANVADSSSKVHVYRWNATAGAYYEHILDGTTGGESVLISGSNVVVGGQNDDTKGTDAGASYIYYWNGLSYENYKLTALDGAQYDCFGSSVSISGNNVVAGVCGDDDNGTNSGSAYVFRKYHSSYEEYKLTASDGSRHDAFGSSTSISGDKVFVGAYEDDDKGVDSGSLYIYNWNGSYYDEINKLTASDGAAGDNFGVSTSSDGNNVVVGAYKDDDNGTDSGSAYVYRWNVNTSSYDQYKLTASDGGSEDYFGNSVSISGDYVAVSAYKDDDMGADSGSVYIYQWNGSTYNEIKKIIASDGAADKQFGSSISISGDSVVVGTKYESGSSAYIYSLTGDVNDPLLKINAPDTTAPSVVTGMTEDVSYYSADLDWTDSIDNVATTEYTIEYSNSMSFNWASTTTVSGSELALSNLNQGSNYYWRVKSKDAVGNESGWSATGTFKTSEIFSAVSINFDGTGKDDILISDGFEVGYYADGLASGWQSLATYTPGWRIVGVADFDGNGKSDILLSNGIDMGYYADGRGQGWTHSGLVDSDWDIVGIGDFDANGKDDILVSDGTQINYYADGLISGQQQLGNCASGWDIAGIADFNDSSGGGKSEILLSDGTQFGYYADGFGTGLIMGGAVSSGWSVTGIGDFDANGQDDILLTDGFEVGYYADGLASGWQSLATYTSGWSIVGAADFDGNGKSDILLSNGIDMGYYADGRGQGWTHSGLVDSDWNIVGIGDFDANGKDDILVSDGFEVGYYADGLISGWQSLATYTSGWSIVGVADFDGNGKSDILLSNGTDIGYYADGLSTGWVSSGMLNSGWSVAGIGDFDANGKDDILLSNGTQIGYYADGLSTGWEQLENCASDWNIVDVADFDADGKSDILFSNGTQVGYYAAGFSSGWTDLGNINSGWDIVIA